MTRRLHIEVCMFLVMSSFGSVVAATLDLPQLETVDERDFGELAELMGFLRSEQKENLFVPVAKLQLSYLVTAANDVEATDAERAREIRRFARGVAFNIASFTWPGWGDSPEPISQARQELGLQAAKRAVELAQQIDDMTPNALWILGVHQLNVKQFDGAIGNFEHAKQLARNEFYRDMHTAWQLFTKALASKDGADLQNLDDAITHLRESDDEDAGFFADQLVTAKTVYMSDDDG